MPSRPPPCAAGARAAQHRTTYFRSVMRRVRWSADGALAPTGPLAIAAAATKKKLSNRNFDSISYMYMYFDSIDCKI